MNSLGAGGESNLHFVDLPSLNYISGAQKPFLVNAANALVFGLMGFFCLFGGPIANRIGLKWTLVLGAVGYPVYSAGLYYCSAFVTMKTTEPSYRETSGSFLLVLSLVVYQLDCSGLLKELLLLVTLHQLSVDNT
jgi:MFS family permease